jgi:hypothetical protein
MHTVMWTFKVPSGTTTSSYQGIPGLICKYYGIAERRLVKAA